DDAGELAVVLLLLPFGLRYRLLLLALRCILGSPAVGQARLDHEGIAAVHGWRPAHRRIEIPFDLLVQAGEDRLFADRREAIGRGGHGLGGWDALLFLPPG